MLLIITFTHPFDKNPLQDQLKHIVFSLPKGAKQIDKIPFRGVGWLVNANVKTNIPILGDELEVFNFMLSHHLSEYEDNPYETFSIVY